MPLPWYFAMTLRSSDSRFSFPYARYHWTFRRRRTHNKTLQRSFWEMRIVPWWDGLHPAWTISAHRRPGLRLCLWRTETCSAKLCPVWTPPSLDSGSGYSHVNASSTILTFNVTLSRVKGWTGGLISFTDFNGSKGQTGHTRNLIHGRGEIRSHCYTFGKDNVAVKCCFSVRLWRNGTSHP
jgi:hypothetical protein